VWRKKKSRLAQLAALPEVDVAEEGDEPAGVALDSLPVAVLDSDFDSVFVSGFLSVFSPDAVASPLVPLLFGA
jgi:hypothetical protein